MTHEHEHHSHTGHSHKGHSHSHGGGHHHEVKSFNTAFAIAVSVTLFYTLAEAGYAFYAHSMSLLADAAHNLGDVLGLLLAWLANWLLSFPPRRRYSYGFKRTTIIAALINAFILVATSALIAYESVRRLLFYLTPINENIVIVMGIIGIFVNGGTSLLFMRGAHDDLNIKGAFLHLMADALILVGVVVSAIIIQYTGILWIDPVVGMIIVAIVLWGTWGLMRDSVILLMDAVPRYIDHAGIEKYLRGYPGVTALHDLHIWGLSTREVALTAHLIAPCYLTDEDYEKINKKLKDEFNVQHATLQVETGSDTAPCARAKRC